MKIFDTEIGKYIKVSKSNALKSRSKPIRVLVRYCVEFNYPTFNQGDYILTNNIPIGLYWYLFAKLRESKISHIGVSRKIVLLMMKDCRTLIKPIP